MLGADRVHNDLVLDLKALNDDQLVQGGVALARGNGIPRNNSNLKVGSSHKGSDLSEFFSIGK